MICYFRGYKFKRRHYIALIAGVTGFLLIIGPFELYSRDLIGNKDLVQRVLFSFQLLEAHHDPRELTDAAVQGFESSDIREQYFSVPGTYIVSRLSLIRSDSNIVSACSNGQHYGFEAAKIDFLNSLPTFLFKNKPRYTDGGDYIGNITGMTSDQEGVSYPVLSAVGDSYGAFGWVGVILFPLLGFSALFVVYDSLFELGRPWGTVAFALCSIDFSEMEVGRLFSLLVRLPIYIVLLSYIVGAIVKMIPVRGDRLLNQPPDRNP
jgi:hypothetical protein